MSVKSQHKNNGAFGLSETERKIRRLPSRTARRNAYGVARRTINAKGFFRKLFNALKGDK
jgi:hypothetical protein